MNETALGRLNQQKTNTMQQPITLSPIEYCQQYVGDKHKQLTLNSVKAQRIYVDGWVNWEYRLTEEELQQIADALGGREKTKSKIKNCLRSLSTLPKKWYLDRIIFERATLRWEYCSGQDTITETAEIRRWFNSL